MTCPTATTLLKPGAHQWMKDARAKYPAHRDDVFDDVHERLVTNGQATKSDLAALITWKHIRTATWMTDLQLLDAETIEVRTKAAFAEDLSDAGRIASLNGIPGFQRGGAVTSVLLSAWRPDEFAVFDKFASKCGWPMVVTADCACPRGELSVWFDHLRQIATELGDDWTPRDVDMALFNLTPEQ